MLRMSRFRRPSQSFRQPRAANKLADGPVFPSADPSAGGIRGVEANERFCGFFSQVARNLRRGLKCKRRQVDLDALQARSRMSRRSMKVDVVVEWLLGFRSYRIVCITNRGGAGLPSRLTGFILHVGKLSIRLASRSCTFTTCDRTTERGLC